MSVGAHRLGDSADLRLDRWLRFEPDGSVTVRTGRVEIGQGVRTALAQIAAEELGLPIERIDMAPVRTGESPDEGVTAGSRSMEFGGATLRTIARSAREALVAEAARRLRVSVDELTCEAGVVTSRTGRPLTFHELAAEGTALAREAVGDPDPVRGRGAVVGTSVPRLDIPAKVVGAPAFVQDLELPGMLHGRVLRPPSYDAALAELDEADIRRLPGVVAVVRDGRFVAVVAEREEQAIRAVARARRMARWDDHAALPSSTDPRFLLAERTTDTVLVSTRDDAAVARAARDHAAEYTRPYIAHASIGPSCAVAVREDDRYTVWTHSQGPYPLRRDIATVLRLAREAVTVIHMEGAGCYGQNCADDAALDAALLARAVPGRPVRVQLMREDEFAWEPYGPAMVVRLSARTAADGAIVDWRHELWSNGHSSRPRAVAPDDVAQSVAARHLARPFRALVADGGSGAERNAVPLYDIPSVTVVKHLVDRVPLRVSSLRSLGAHANVFAIESFMDEIAAAHGADPVAHRLRHLADPRARAVVEAVAERAGWRPHEAGDGMRGRGIAFARYKNTAAYAAVIVEVELAQVARVTRAWAAIDAGTAVHPDGLVNQTEGGIIQAVSWTLKEQIAFDAERVTTRTWADYPILTFSEAPAVDVAIVEEPGRPALGAGEAVAGPTAAAIANAIHRASGLRLRDMPFSRERIVAALGEAT